MKKIGLISILLLLLLLPISLTRLATSDTPEEPIGLGSGIENQYTDAKVRYSSLDYENADGSRNLILYSGTQYGYEDKHWKPIEELHSFKGTTNIACNVIEDKMTSVKCLDWNYTSVKLDIS